MAHWHVEKQPLWNICFDQIVLGPLAFSQIVFSSAKRCVWKPLKSLALCNYYSLTRPERRAQCKRYGYAPGPREGAGIEGGERGGMMDGGEAGEGTGHGERIMFIRPTAWRLWALPSLLAPGVYLPFKLEAADLLELEALCSRSWCGRRRKSR